MRILEFTVRQQRLNKSMTCSFGGLIAGTKGYLHAKFEFLDDSWNECSHKIASFWLDNKEAAMILDENNMCIIPPEVLTGEEFRVYLIGANKDFHIETNELKIKQEVKENGNSK